MMPASMPQREVLAKIFAAVSFVTFARRRERDPDRALQHGTGGTAWRSWRGF